MPPVRLTKNILRHHWSLCLSHASRKGVHCARLLLLEPLQDVAFATALQHHWKSTSSYNSQSSSFRAQKRPTLGLHSAFRLWSRKGLHSTSQPRLHSFQSSRPTSRQDNIVQCFAELHQRARKGEYKEVQEIARKLLGEYGEKPSDRIYEALILVNTDCWYGSANEVAMLLQDMEAEGIEPDSAILHAALRVLAIHPDYLLRSHVLHEMRQRWLSLTQTGWHDVVVGLLRDRQLERALDALEQMREEGVAPISTLYDTVLYTLCSAEEFDGALRLLDFCLESDDLSISPTLWAHVLDSASRASHYPLTLLAFNARVQTSYLNPSSGVCTNVLSTAARQGDPALATSVLHILSRRTGGAIQRHHYDALLETYIATKNLQMAFMLLVTMKKAGFPPTEESTRPIFRYLRHSHRSPKKAHEVLYLLRDKGHTILIQAINVLIESYIHHQNLSAALELYKSMQTLSSELSPNIATFNSLLRGCALYKRKDVAMFLVSEMVALEVAPEALTYDRLILICLSGDEGLDNAWRYFEEMKAAGWWPRGGTLYTFAKKACAKGDPRAWDLVQDEQGRGIAKEKLDSLWAENSSSDRKIAAQPLN